MWRGQVVTVEYVADDCALISYPERLARRWLPLPWIKCAIVSLSDLSLVN
jgi:hypothetical protein